MARTTKTAAAKINAAISGALKNFRPPESLTVDEWADRHRRLSPESSAEAGPWRTKRTPYLEEPMKAFTDPKVRKIVMVAASQVGKSELELNIIGYIIDQDPGSILYVHPTIEDARKFSRLRVAPMIRDSKRLKAKVHDVKAKDSGNTILQKSFPGGMLTLTGSNSASALASTPARYIIGDERDRWATSAGTEGDPWALTEISFSVTNSNLPVFTATEGDNNNILEWSNINYNPANELFNMSRCVFKRNDNSEHYSYVDSKDAMSIFKYQEQCTLMTLNEKTSEKEAYWNAKHNEKFNPVQTYNFTITVKGFPDLKFGELVKVVANMKKLNTLKEVNSISMIYNIKDKPVIQTELGLGELAPDIQIDKTIKQMRDNAKKETTSFFGTASPVVNEDIYEWEQ